MILLDTCILLKIVNDSPLPAPLRSALAREPWAVSVLSAWEIGIKHAAGRLTLEATPVRWWPRVVEHYRLTELSFTAGEALLAASLPALHADPFDRGIIASGIERNLAVATVDPVFSGYVIPCGLTLIR